jgi:hypothetical protein
MQKVTDKLLSMIGIRKPGKIVKLAKRAQ